MIDYISDLPFLMGDASEFAAALDALESVAPQYLLELRSHELHAFDQRGVRRTGRD